MGLSNGRTHASPPLEGNVLPPETVPPKPCREVGPSSSVSMPEGEPRVGEAIHASPPLEGNVLPPETVPTKPCREVGPSSSVSMPEGEPRVGEAIHAAPTSRASTPVSPMAPSPLPPRAPAGFIGVPRMADLTPGRDPGVGSPKVQPTPSPSRPQAQSGPSPSPVPPPKAGPRYAPEGWAGPSDGPVMDGLRRIGGFVKDHKIAFASTAGAALFMGVPTAIVVGGSILAYHWVKRKPNPKPGEPSPQEGSSRHEQHERNAEGWRTREALQPERPKKGGRWRS